MIRILSSIFILLLVTCTPGKKNTYSLYMLNTTVVPDSSYLKVNLNFNYNPYIPEDTVRFYLNRNLKIDAVWARNLVYSNFDTVTPAGIPELPGVAILSLVFDPVLTSNQRVSINIDYSGFLDTTGIINSDYISSGWIELSRSSPWFPCSYPFEEFFFTINLVISKEYHVVSNAHVHLFDNFQQIFCEFPREDIIIVASRDLVTKKCFGKKSKVSLICTEDCKLSPDEEDELCDSFMGKYKDAFGDTETGDLNIVYSPYHKGAGFMRKGFIMIGDTVN